MSEFTICAFNVENLFISMEYYDGQDLTCLPEDAWRKLALAQLQNKQKPLAKLWGLTKAILEINPDVLMLVEVGGAESLHNFNRYFLGNSFTAFFIEGNSKRNIDLGFLVKKDLPLRVEAGSNRDRPVEVYTYYGKYLSLFSRDVAELKLYDNSELKLILLLTHLKSKISSDTDFKGKDVRTAEATALVSLYEGLKVAHPKVPIIMGGDFNAELSSLELELLCRSDLTDFHDLVGTLLSERFSLIYFDREGKPLPQILDYILVSPGLRERVVKSKSYTYRYKGFYGIPDELPKTVQARYQMPSDHYPLVLTVEL